MVLRRRRRKAKLVPFELHEKRNWLSIFFYSWQNLSIMKWQCGVPMSKTSLKKLQQLENNIMKCMKLLTIYFIYHQRCIKVFMEKYLKRKKKCYGKRRQSGNRKIAVADKKTNHAPPHCLPLTLDVCHYSMWSRSWVFALHAVFMAKLWIKSHPYDNQQQF